MFELQHLLEADICNFEVFHSGKDGFHYRTEVVLSDIVLLNEEVIVWIFKRYHKRRSTIVTSVGEGSKFVLKEGFPSSAELENSFVVIGPAGDENIANLSLQVTDG